VLKLQQLYESLQRDQNLTRDRGHRELVSKLRAAEDESAELRVRLDASEEVLTRCRTSLRTAFTAFLCDYGVESSKFVPDLTRFLRGFTLHRMVSEKATIEAHLESSTQAQSDSHADSHAMKVPFPSLAGGVA